jgi:Intracellular proteinase inhibitor
VRPLRPRPNSVGQLTITIIVLVLLVLFGVSFVSHQAAGEPLVPARLAELLHRPDPTLPQGMTYDFEILDPRTERPLPILPDHGDVEFRFAVTNDSALPMTLSFPSVLQCEFVARRVHSYLGGLIVLPLEVWRSSYFHNIRRSPTTLRLVPGQTQVYVAEWTIEQSPTAPTPPGEYRLVASFYGVEETQPLTKPF